MNIDITNRYRPAQQMARCIRGYRSIETYHWVKDVICSDDDCLTA